MLLGLDQLSKVWAHQSLAGRPPFWVAGVLQFTYCENRGGWGSLGAGWNDLVRSFALLWMPGLILLGVLLYVVRSRHLLPGWQSLALTMVAAGGLGNLLDRQRLGHVVDFLYLGVGPIGTNIFNIADMAVLFGVLIIFFGPSVKQTTEPV